MSEQTSAPRRINQRFIIWGIVGLLILIGILFLLRMVAQGDTRPLLPVLPPPTVVNVNADQQPTTLSLPELNSDPFAYLNQTVQISGAYTPLPSANCQEFRGPDIRWALVADDLQLDALGYERVVKILQPGTPMTVQGIWRLYQGPRGCGKGPERADIWYLQVTMIMQPHPLVSNGSSGSVLNVENGVQNNPPLLPTLVPGEDTPTPQAGLPTATVDTAVTSILPTATPVVTLPPALTPTATIIGQTPTATFTPLPTATPPGPVTQPPPTTTPDGAATATAVTPEGTPGTPAPTATAVSPLPTGTPGSYPASTSTPVPPSPTNTPDGY